MDAELKEVVDDWIKMSEALSSPEGQNGPEDIGSTFWASELLFELVQNEPEKAWPILLAIRKATNNHEVLSHLAASHFEDLINMHGEKFIARIEELCKNDKEFRHFIGGIWPKENMPQELQDRFKAIALKPHWD
jgi:hypothetical protein